jgi:hypothetical protein
MIHEVLLEQHGRNIQEKLCLNIIVDNSCGHGESCQPHEPQQQQPNNILGAIPALCWMKASYHPAPSNRGKNSKTMRHRLKVHRSRPHSPRSRWSDSSDGLFLDTNDFSNKLPHSSPCYDGQRTLEPVPSKNFHQRNKTMDSPPHQPSRRSPVTKVSLNSILDQAMSLGLHDDITDDLVVHG